VAIISVTCLYYYPWIFLVCWEGQGCFSTFI